MSRSSGRKGLTPEIKRVLFSFMSSMRVSRSVILRGEMVRVPFRHGELEGHGRREGFVSLRDTDVGRGS